MNNITSRITPTYGKNGLSGCYICHAWFNGKANSFIVTAVDIAGNELAWKATSDPTEVGNIVKEFTGS